MLEEERLKKLESFYHIVEENPVIAAVKDMEGLKKSCELKEIKVIFILFGDICSIKEIVHAVKKSGKTAMVHIDLISGLSSKEVSVDFIHEHTETDGIISTKLSLIEYAKSLSMYTVLRFFVMDSLAFQYIKNLEKQARMMPDFIEVLPGVMPKILHKIYKESSVPMIAGGLIADKEDVMGALKAGAMAVSTTDQNVWKL